MPIPYVEECQTSMNSVATAKTTILEAIAAIREYANDETWSGGPAEAFTTDLEGHLKAAETSLGGPLDTAKQECLKHAQALQAQSGRAANDPKPGG